MAEGGGRYQARFVGNATQDGHTVYIVTVVGPEGDTWNIQKRYRAIRDLHDTLKAEHADKIPAFPGRRFFGGMDPAFIATRTTQLQQWIDAVLKLDICKPNSDLLKFLGGTRQPDGPSSSAQYQQILQTMQKKLLNLALPPAPLDEQEMKSRITKYGQAMRLHVLSMPVDPIHLRAPGFDGEPPQLWSGNAERLEALKAPPGEGDGPVLSGLLDALHAALRPETPIADPERLLVPFPSVEMPAPSA